MCYEPDTVLWKDLYNHLIYDKELGGEQIKCTYFTYKKETTNGCSFCLVYESAPPNLLTIDKKQQISLESKHQVNYFNLLMQSACMAAIFQIV